MKVTATPSRSLQVSRSHNERFSVCNHQNVYAPSGNLRMSLLIVDPPYGMQRPALSAQLNDSGHQARKRNDRPMEL